MREHVHEHGCSHDRTAGMASHTGGGYLGMFLSAQTTAYMGRTGSVIILMALLFISIITRRSSRSAVPSRRCSRLLRRERHQDDDGGVEWREEREREKQRRDVIAKHTKKAGADPATVKEMAEAGAKAARRKTADPVEPPGTVAIRGTSPRAGGAVHQLALVDLALGLRRIEQRQRRQRVVADSPLGRAFVVGSGSASGSGGAGMATFGGLAGRRDRPCARRSGVRMRHGPRLFDRTALRRRAAFAPRLRHCLHACRVRAGLLRVFRDHLAPLLFAPALFAPFRRNVDHRRVRSRRR